MAKFVEWTDALSVGIQEIDEQHKVLIGLINRLFEETVINKSNPHVIQDVIHDLVEYTIVHFAVEESLFRIFGYPDIDAHMKLHQALKQQVLDIQDKVRKGDVMVNTELLMFLKKWLENHIMHEDKRYAPFLINQGVKSTWSKKGWIGKIWK